MASSLCLIWFVLMSNQLVIHVAYSAVQAARPAAQPRSNRWEHKWVMKLGPLAVPLDVNVCAIDDIL